MPVVTVAHIVFDNSNDPGRVARRHVGKEIGTGMKQTDIVSNAWQRRHAPVPNVITSTTWQAPPFAPSRQWKFIMTPRLWMGLLSKKS